MGIHITIGEAEKRLAELVAAALRGEEVVLLENGAGVRLVAEPARSEPTDEEKRQIAAQRREAIGMWRAEFDGYDTSLAALKADRVDMDERFRRKFGPVD